MQAGVHQVVTFASAPFRGNPAFVLSLPRRRRTRCSPPSRPSCAEGVLAATWPAEDGRMALRFFTPEGPHAGAGHATLAAAHVELARRADGNTVDLRARRRHRADRRARWRSHRRSLAAHARRRRRSRGTISALPSAASRRRRWWRRSAMSPSMVRRPRCRTCGRTWRRSPASIAAPSSPRRPATAPTSSSASSRRKLGLPEDPVCGTAHRILAPYWAARLGRGDLHSRQLSLRGGDLYCRMAGDSVSIGGQSRTFLQGVIELPDG